MGRAGLLPDQCRQCAGALRPRLQLERLARDPVVPVRRLRDAGRVAGAATQRARARRRVLRSPVRPRQGLRRSVRPGRLPDAGRAADAMAVAAAVLAHLHQRRDVRQRRRPDPLAGDADVAAGLRAARAAGAGRDRQAHRLVAAPPRDGHALRAPPAMTMEQFAPLMFAGLIVVLLIGFPVAFSLAAYGLLCGFIAIEAGWFPPEFMSALPLNVFGILSNDLLLAIPFFTLMGAVLEKCGLAEDMLDSMGQLFGPVRGGLGYSVIIVGFVLGAITGTVAGQVIAMAMISLPVMMRYRYDMRYSTGVLAASGTITQLVPPSLVLIVMADQLGRPVGDMYKGAWGPAILQVLLFAAYTFVLSRLRPAAVPGVPKEARTLSGGALWIKCLRGIIPSALLIFAVLGSMGGLPGMDHAIATPTEAGAMGAVGAFLLAALHRRLSWPLLRDALAGTMRITAMVVFILIGSRVFSLVFQGVDGGKWVEHMLSGL
eukprot:Opistho-1_new@105615